MTKLVPDYTKDINGTSRVGVFIARESELRALLGEPGEGDGYKVSLEWEGYAESADGELRVFTVYDWKETSLYDEDLMTPLELSAADFPREWHIGGHDKRTADLVLEALRVAGIGRAGVVA